MKRIAMLEVAGLLVFASLGAAAQQPATPAPTQGQQMQREHNMGGMGQGTTQGNQGAGHGQSQGTTQGQGGMGMGGMGQGSQGQGTSQGQGGMGGMGMGGMMDHMHQRSGTPPSSAHAPATPGATTPQCPPGTSIQMDEKGQHLCK